MLTLAAASLLFLLFPNGSLPPLSSLLPPLLPTANPIQQFLVTYEGWLAKKPILTKALTSAVGFALGDILAQCFLGGDAAFDWARFARVASFGFVLHGTTGHVWYGKLDQLLPGTEAWKVAVKVAADQVLWAPIFTAMYFSYLGLAEGRSMEYIQAKIQNDTMAGVTASWKVWPIVHAVSFRFVPTELRILYINSIQVRWRGVSRGERGRSGGRVPCTFVRGVRAMGCGGAVGVDWDAEDYG